MKKILSKLQKIEDFILFLTFVIMILGAFAQVLNRNIFKFGISWLEEISRYCMVYMALLATEAGLRDGSQISLTVTLNPTNSTLHHARDVVSVNALRDASIRMIQILQLIKLLPQI